MHTINEVVNTVNLDPFFHAPSVQKKYKRGEKLQLTILAQVAIREGSTATEVANALGINRTIVSNVVRKLSDGVKRHGYWYPPMGLIARAPDVSDARQKLLYLTPKAKVLFAGVANA